MLTIEQESPVRNKLVIASLVFGVGFIGSLSMLRVLWPESEQLSSGRQSQAVSRAERNEEDKDGNTQQKEESPETASVSDDAAPTGTSVASGVVVPPIINQPTNTYTAPISTAPQPSTGTVQVSGTMPASTEQPTSGTTTTTTLPTSPVSTPSLSSPTAPVDPLSTEQGSTSTSPSSPTPQQTDPVTSLTQSLSDTTDTLLPSF